VFFWGPLMAGALLGSIPVAIVYSFFVEHYVAGLTGLGQRAERSRPQRGTGAGRPSADQQEVRRVSTP
jgi:hypothetical protein